MVLQNLADLVHINLSLVVLRLHAFQLVGALLKEAEEALILVLRLEAFKLRHHAA